MSLKNYQAYNNVRNNRPKQTYYDDMTAIQDLAFENAPNVYYGDSDDRVEYEAVIGSNQYQPIPIIRVDDVVDYNTGLFDTNDFKTFIFSNDFTEADNFRYGSKFKWKDNIWLAINVGTINGLINSLEVRRCNNVARFYNDSGVEIYEPCILDNILRFTRNLSSASVVTSNGEQKLWIQRNENTGYIKANTRFLFGPSNDRKAWKVYGSGEKNYLNTTTFDDNGVSLTEIYMTHDAIDEQRDDIERGFADARVPLYKIVGSNFSGEYKINDVIKLDFKVYKGDNIVNEDISYDIDDYNIAMIENNEIVITDLGNTTVHVYMSNNINIKLDFEIKVVENPISDYTIKISPDLNYLLQGQSQVFTCGLYNNGTLDNTITDFDIKDVSSGVPNNKYFIKQLDTNSFELINKSMFMGSPVQIKCSTGNHENVFSFEMRGVY